MRILAVVAEPPHPPRSGYRIRCWEILSRLAAAHEVRLVTLSRDGAAPGGEWRERFASVASISGGGVGPRELAASLLTRRPHHELAHLPSDLHALLEREAAGCDVVYVHYLYFAAALPWDVAPRPAIVLDQHNLDRTTWWSHAAAASEPRAAWLRFQARAIERMERAWLPRFDAVLSVSEGDAATTREVVTQRTRVSVARNGADCARLRPAPFRETGATVLFSATSSRRNVDGLAHFLENAWPSVRARVPRAQLLVAGSLDPSRLPRRLRGDASVSFTGERDSIDDAFRAADLAIVPVRLGGGTKLKVFEALASGLPVVAHPSAVEEGCCTRDRGVLAEPQDVAQAAVMARLLEDVEERRKLAAAARQHAERVHDWVEIASVVEAELRHVADRHAGDGLMLDTPRSLR